MLQRIVFFLEKNPRMKCTVIQKWLLKYEYISS